MHFSSVITLCLVSLMLSSKPLGSWEPDSFARNDIHLDRSRSLSQKEYLKVANEMKIIFFLSFISIQPNCQWIKF